MTSKEKHNLRKKWKRWLKTIGYDIGNLLTSKDIHDEIRRLAAFNKQIMSPYRFYSWLVENYVDSVAIGIRRLDDNNKKSISLYRLIEDISTHREAITRDYYISCHSTEMQEYADKDFDNFANRKNNYVSKYKLNKDLNQLKRVVKRIRKFTNKWIAHRDLKRKKIKIPTHKDVDNALRDCDELFCKYFMLLTRNSMTTCKPTLQYDWKEPLRHTWLTKDYKKKIANAVRKELEGMS